MQDHAATKFLFDLLPTSVSRLVAQQAAKSRPHKNLIPISGLKPGDIVATLRIRRDTWKGGVEEIFHIGEVGAVSASTERLSVKFFSDDDTCDYEWDDKETLKIVKTNDLSVGGLPKVCSPHVIDREFFYRDSFDDGSDGLGEYLPVTITGF